MSDVVVQVNNLSKCFKIYRSPWSRALEWASYGRRICHKDFWALKGISFEVKRGECLGIIGPNGAGKSTLLKILTRSLYPTQGTFEIGGNVLSLLELGTGFNAELTGRQNIYRSSQLLGFPKDYVSERLQDMQEFAEIGDFFDRPIKIYSSGMYVRLAFSMFVFLKPEVLIVDEALAVGDIFFQQKCHARMQELMDRQTAIILVSHDMPVIERYSTRTLLLDQGRCLFLGQPNEAVQRYYKMERSFTPRTGHVENIHDVNLRFDSDSSEPNPTVDWPATNAFLNLNQAVVLGKKDVARCRGIAVCNNKREPCTTFQIGETVCFYYEFELLQDIDVPVGGVVLTNKMNINVHGKNSLHHRLKAPLITQKGSRVRFRQTIQLDVAAGEYTFMIGFATISPVDYLHANEMYFSQLSCKIKDILGVCQVGTISVCERSLQSGPFFHGYTNLKGDCHLSVLNDDEHG
jgi:ABC-type polysaccharide/polyol phosphate transport system ATPase subunit